MSEDHSKFEYSQITDDIFIGTNMCCGMHAQDLQSLGIETDIDLEEERQEAPSHLAVYLWLPVKDLQAPTLVAAYFISQGKTAEKAIATIKQKRPEIHLEQVQIAALNDFVNKKGGVSNG